MCKLIQKWLKRFLNKKRKPEMRNNIVLDCNSGGIEFNEQ